MNVREVDRRPSPRILMVIGVWLAVALSVGASGLLASAPVPPPAIPFALSAVVLLLLWLSPRVREHTRTLGSVWLIAFHLIRLIAGAYFLYLYQHGRLPAEFALSAGWGDIFVAAGAILVLWLCFPLHAPLQRLGLLLWNSIGLLDILLVLGNAVRMFRIDPAIADEFTRLPLALLPTFVVPIVIVSHLLLFAWHLRTTAPPYRVASTQAERSG